MIQTDDRITLLVNCQKIPVMTPGTIQSHGALIACNKRDKKIDYVSENIGDTLGQSAQHWLTRSLTPEAHPYFPAILQALAADTSGTLKLADQELRIVVEETHYLLEFCRLSSDDQISDAAWNTWSKSLLDAKGPRALHQAAMHALHDVIDFDHLMVYRFDENWNGQVNEEWINQRADAHYERYQDLCFPESDIPVQARAMYQRYWVRNTSDVHAAPVPLLSHVSQPLPLAAAYLRSVAPTHVQYLKNMGVTASFSLSIIIDGKLWGLLAAHHAAPRPLSLATLAATEELARLYSTLLTLELRKEHQDWLDRHAKFLNAPTVAASTGNDPFDMPPQRLEQFCTVFSCHAAILWDGGVKASHGDSPDELWLARLVESLGKKTFTEHVFQTAQVREAMPELPISPFAGVLALSAPIEADRVLLLLRKEEPQEIQWGGDPRLDAMPIQNGNLNPRNSFGIWKQTLSGVSRPWTAPELVLGKAFSNNLIMANAILGTMESVQKSAKLNLLNMLLHDIGNALAGVSGGTTHLHRQTQDQTALQNLKRLSEYVESHIAALDTALGAGRGAALHQLLFQINTAIANTFGGIAQATEWIETSMTHARELLDLQKIYAQSTNQYNRECRIVELLSDAASVMRTSIDNRGKVIMTLADHMPAITVDRSKLMQVIINLIKNGFEAWDARSGDKPALEIHLNAYVDHETLYIQVQDNGSGFDAQQAEKLFVTSYSTKERSSGVGLLNCKRLANHTGVDIALQSGGRNMGATATLSIPKELWA